MRVDKTTPTTIEAELNGMKVTWTRDLADHELPTATVAFLNEIALLVREQDEE